MFIIYIKSFFISHILIRMSENNIKKFKTSQAQLDAVKKYRAKRTEKFLEHVKKSNKKYYEKRKEMSDKYKELQDSGIIEKLNKFKDVIDLL